MASKNFLPYADILKMFVLNQSMPRTTLKDTLRRRGVFFGDETKENLASFLTRASISPSEFDILQDAVKTREENPKVRTQSITVGTVTDTLFDALGADFNLIKIVEEATPFSNYEIVGTPAISPVNSNLNHLELDFTLERRDLTKSWDQKTERFDGKVAIKLVGEDIGLTFTQTHTSAETKDVVEKATRDILKRLRDSNFIAREATVAKIKFSDFSNVNRFKFFKKILQQRSGNELTFGDIRQISIRPTEEGNTPEPIRWMDERFKSISFKGDRMQSTIFLNDESVHPYIEAYSMQALTSFKYVDFEGDCTIICDFPDLISKSRRDAELFVSVENVTLSNNTGNLKMSKIKEKILEVIDIDKMKAYKELANTNA